MRRDLVRRRRRRIKYRLSIGLGIIYLLLWSELTRMQGSVRTIDDYWWLREDAVQDNITQCRNEFKLDLTSTFRFSRGQMNEARLAGNRDGKNMRGSEVESQ